mmetsp:Transcript_84580/g.272630  ORF Transcript_84580/g.272630 Transcript_84580/m.272630 type:complete len:118 (-) Transcript_84580:138-491(-)
MCISIAPPRRGCIQLCERRTRTCGCVRWKSIVCSTEVNACKKDEQCALAWHPFHDIETDIVMYHAAGRYGDNERLHTLQAVVFRELAFLWSGSPSCTMQQPSSRPRRKLGTCIAPLP